MKRYKKNLLAAATFLFCSLSLSAQSADHNYVKQETMLNASKSQKITSVQYYDGYSRPVLLAGNGTAGNGKYTFALTTYDNVGRISESWLPAVGTTSSDFIAASEVQSLSDTTYGDSYAYTRNHYDALGRTTSVDGIGSAWRSAGKKVITAYGTNTWNEVRKYTATSGSTTLSYSAYYGNGVLSVETTTDEDGKTHAVYKDATGKTILERSAGNHDTYYVYDDMDRLRFVLPPCANDALSSNGSWSMDSNDVLRDYAYYYEYDGRGRCIKKKLPGAEPVLQEYDNRNRMTFSQDGNQRTNSQWTYYLYDGLDRLTEQGVCPDKSLTSKNVHIVNHYDGYDFVGTGMFAAPEFEAGSVSGKGLLTGSVAYGLNVAGPVRTVFHYDNKGRVVKETASNGLNGFDTRVTTYSFTDKPLTVTHTHTASGKEGLTEVYTYTYDHADRLSSVKHRLNDGTEVVLANYTYDDLGRIQAKKLHNSTHTTSYAYNVRGWTTGITNGNFTQSLTYNNGTAGFNGNITAMTWTAGGSSHSYAFTYDGLNRMLNATHDTNAYTEKVTGYDKNGNITGLQRYGNGLIDNLAYTYNGNQLTKVEDATGNATGFIDGASQANEYSYDNNGNLTQDLNKGITNISYNFLNLPQQIRYSNGVVVNYGYSADGVKQRVQHLNSGLPNVVYCGNVIYEGDVAKLLLTEEGYIDLANGNAYYYYLKDHQGNNRVVINGSGTVMETNHYYPFGGVFSTSTNVQPYKYNGKELDTKNGLNWYDYGARHYDAILGRWFVVDPLAEKYYSTSPYTYCLNNPVKYVDPTGLSTWVMQNEDGTYRVVGGDLEDKDRNIYVYSIQDGQLVRGESIGITTSITSFYNSDANDGEGAWAIGSNINPNDQSGNDFLSNIIGNNPAMLDDYAMNATKGEKYDFKVTNGTNEKFGPEKFYRGMPIGKNANGQTIYTSARDIGNIAAGYVAGSNGMPWAASRIAFDLYQGGIEGISTQNAEYYGWRMGYNQMPHKKMNNFKRSMKSLLEKLW